MSTTVSPLNHFRNTIKAKKHNWIESVATEVTLYLANKDGARFRTSNPSLIPSIDSFIRIDRQPTRIDFEMTVRLPMVNLREEFVPTRQTTFAS